MQKAEDVLKWTAEEQALLDMYEGSDEEKKEQMEQAIEEMENPEIMKLMEEVIQKF